MSYQTRNTAMGEIATNVKLYERLKMAYLGNGDFADGTILIEHDRETSNGYKRRKESVSYANYFKPLIDVGINSVFSREPVREYSNDVQFEAFIGNVDGKHSLTKYMRKVATTAKKLGSAWVFMDNSPQPAATIEEAVRDRKLPYLFTVEPHMIQKFQLDYLGNLVSVSYFEQYINELGEEKYYSRTWTNEAIIFADEFGTTIERKENTLGTIPCLVFISSEQELEEGAVPFPEYTNIYQLNAKIVNVDSLITNGLYQQGFSILLLAGQFDEALELGESSAINYDKNGDGTVDAPSFISPDAAPIKTMMEYMDLLKTQIQEQSITKIASTNSENQSGTAKRIDNIDKSKSLENQAKYIESFEVLISELFGQYIGKELNYEVEYYKDFDIDDVITSLEEAHSALLIPWKSVEVPDAIRAKQIKNIFGERDRDVINDLLAAEEKSVGVEPVIEGEELDENGEPVVVDPMTETDSPTMTKDVSEVETKAPVAESNEDLKAMILDLKAVIEAQAKASEDKKVEKEANEQAAQAITINNNNAMEQDANKKADLNNVKALINKAMYDLSIGVIDEAKALIIIKSFGFDEEKARMIIGRVKV